MSLNAKPKILFDNILNIVIPTATDTDADSRFDKINIADWRYYTKWQAASAGTKYITYDLNQTVNGGMETGDGTGWDLHDSTVDAVVFRSGAFSMKDDNSGGLPHTGAHMTTAIPIDYDRTYRIKYYHNVTAYTAGNYNLYIRFYVDEAKTQLIQVFGINAVTATTGGWVLTSKTVSKSGSDITIPAGANYIEIGSSWAGVGAVGVGYFDDLLFYEERTADSFAMANHNMFDSKALVSLEYNNDDSETIDAAWTFADAAVLNYTPPDNLAFNIAFPALTVRAWRIKIVTVHVVPFVGMAWVDQLFTFEKYPQGPFDPDPETQKSQLTKSMGGYPLGIIIDYFERQINANFKNLSPDWIADTFSLLWVHLRQGLPVVWIWDITNHEDEVYIGSLPPNFKRSMPYTPVTHTLNLKLDTIVEKY